MLRERLNDELKTALKSQDERAVSTIRLIMAALKDRDIAERTKGNPDGLDEAGVLQMLQTMIKQRRDSIQQYETGGRLELAEREREEIEVIERFLPEQFSEARIAEVVDDTIKELDANSIKDMGRTMAVLRERYAGQMDFAKASGIVKSQLAR